MTPIPNPFVSEEFRVLPAWVDENKHMNVAYYLKCFDDAFNTVGPRWGMDYKTVDVRGYTTFAARSNLEYIQELLVYEPFRIETRLVDHDRKRIHWLMTMHSQNGRIAAICEWLQLFVDIHKRKVAAMPDNYFDRLVLIRKFHSDLPQHLRARVSIDILINKRSAFKS